MIFMLPWCYIPKPNVKSTKRSVIFNVRMKILCGSMEYCRCDVIHWENWHEYIISTPKHWKNTVKEASSDIRTCYLKIDPFFKKSCKWNVVNILSYFLVLLHNPDILDISMVKYIDYSLTLWTNDILMISLEYVTIFLKKILWWKIGDCKYCRKVKTCNNFWLTV